VREERLRQVNRHATEKKEAVCGGPFREKPYHSLMRWW
jgi:hypothetical protein